MLNTGGDSTVCDERKEIRLDDTTESARSQKPFQNGYEEQMQKYEAQIRNHISVE